MDILGVSSATGSQDTLLPSTSVLGKDEFLRLLTIQMQNQDPLDPLDNKELIAQLTEFSSLEQLENMNTNLENTVNLDLMLTQVLNNTAAAGLIGKSVVAEGDQVELDSVDSVSLNFDLASEARRVVITIHDSAGTAIRTIETENLQAGRNEVSWDGTGSDGRRAAQGIYTFKVQAFDASDNPIDVTTLVVGEIGKVKFSEGEAIIMVAGLEIPISQIVEIYEEESTG